MRFISALCAALLFGCLAGAPAFAADEPFTGPANSGGTGLMEIPSARVMRKNAFRIGISQIDPYRYYYGAMSPVTGLEIGGKMTEILGTEVAAGDPNWQGYGNNKDKSVAFKYQFLPEGKWLPAVALGVDDPHGTRLYPSQYLVASKQIYPFDFTIGFGNGRFGKRLLPSQGEGIAVEMLTDNASWRQDGQFFAGVQFALSESLFLMAEYSPIRFEDRPADLFTEPVRSKINYGLRWRFGDWVETDLSYQRGNQVGVNVSLPFEIGRPIIPIYEPPYRENVGAAFLPLEARISLALGALGFSSIGVKIESADLTIDLQNNKYFFTSRAVESALAAIEPIIRVYASTPERVESILLILKVNGVPLYSFRTKAVDLAEYAAERFTYAEFHSLAALDTGYVRLPEGSKYQTPGFVLGYKPQFQLFLNDPSGFWKGKLGLSFWASRPLWAGGELTAGAAIYPFSSFDTVNEPLSIPVRTDIMKYIGHKALFERFLFSQVNRLPDTSIFTRFTAGILETQYAGLDAEAALPVLGGRFLFGVSGSMVKKRDPDNPLRLAEDTVMALYKTAFLNARVNFPDPDISLDVKYGQFLAGDRGARVTVSKFIKGVTLSAWYSLTDTSVFSDGINNGYHDKGISVMIPIRLFTGHDSRAVYGQAISPWTRDVAQDIDHFSSLFDVIGRNTDVFIRKDLDRGRWH